MTGRAALVEKVAAMFRNGPDGMYSAENLANIAIDLALEEAALEADKIEQAERALHEKDGDRYSQGKANGAMIIAAAIRAMKGKP